MSVKIRPAFSSPFVLGFLAPAIADAHAGWSKGAFSSNGKPVEQYHCVPAGNLAHPVVVLLPGCGRRDAGNGTMEQMCAELASRGYYTEFIE